MFEDKLSVMMVIGTILVFVISIFMKWFNFGVLLAIFLLIVTYFSFYLAIKKMYEIDIDKLEEEDKDKKKFPYCWKRVNAILKEMPGYNTIQWDKGFNIKSSIKNYQMSGRIFPFMSILAKISNTYQNVVIIYDISKDNIVEYDSSPSVEKIMNPFEDFKPFESGMSMDSQFGGINGMYRNPRDRRYRKYPRGINIDFGGDDYGGNDNSNQRILSPSDEELEKAKGRL